MTLTAFALVLVAAAAHSLWNLLAKRSKDKVAFMWCVLATAAVLYTPLAFYLIGRDGLEPIGTLIAVVSALLNVVYFWSLARGYEVGDLSVVYPIARGMGAIGVLALALPLLGERVSAVGVLGIFFIVVGIGIVQATGLYWRALLAPLRALGRADTRFALLAGLSLAAYTVCDKVGVGRVSPLIYNYLLYAGCAASYGAFLLPRHWPGAQWEWKHNRWAVIAMGVLAPSSYLLVLLALSLGQVSYIAPAREISIPLGALLGTLVLREPYGPNRVVGSILIASGVVALGLAS